MTRLLQLSDPHIVPEGQLAYGVVDTAAALADAVDTINRDLHLYGPVDLAIVTGDLTDFGSPEEYARFRNIMDGLPIPYRVIPGNHDLRENLRQAFSEDGWMPDSGPIVWSVDLPDFGVVALDTLVEGQHHGLLDDRAVRFLVDALEAFNGKPVLVATHHPPFATGIIPMDVNNLRNGSLLRDILDAYAGETRLICGHVHRSVTTVYGSSVAMIAPGVSHSVTLDQREENPHTLSLEPGGFMLHEWRNGLVSHTVAARFPADRHPFSSPEEKPEGASRA
ncbi:phosphodiesterase [Hoeflea olei]|uniref:Metallophosphoesterase n=1 Tax=Hoeflea olei TaxID=1480615 RepID=A0A1C1YU43_9HYPH|nr:phosphodiesterase [Hoeflea olei]OCW57032.1 metallophosphoesterase [Hoeflea olei]